MRNYAAFYEKISAPLRRHPSSVKALKMVNRVLTLAVYAAYPALLLRLMCEGWQGGGLPGAASRMLPYLLVPGTGFLLVTAVRDRINEARPYEAWPIDALIHKGTKGHSMPSRHVFSSAVIAVCVLDLHAGFGILMLLIAGLLAVVRVIGGVHYPKDVAAGYAAGVAAGCILLLW